MSTKLHVLNTGQSDCIILESEDHLALIDSGEDSDYPKNKPWLNYKGYENKVVDYLLNNFKSADGKVHIDFIIATHCHSDHMGGFDTVIRHPDIEIKKAHIKPYRGYTINLFERLFWDNSEVYCQTIDALVEKDIPIVNSTYEDLGSCRVYLFNATPHESSLIKRGENTNSIVTYIVDRSTGYRIVLMGDLNYRYKFERKIFDSVGCHPVDILKVGHHGHLGSTPLKFIRTASPKISIVCGSCKKSSKYVNYKLRKYSGSVKYTADCKEDIVIQCSSL